VIVTPVSRFLAVADVGRSSAFYRDVLGFGARGNAVESGPARIEFVREESAPDSVGERRPRGAAIVFFETSDVAGLRTAVEARGGKPSAIERANWIKMRVFEIRDPDGHVLWFGQSFQEPEPGKDPQRQLRQALPELPLSDVSAGVAYYQKVLGFRINYAQDDLGVMYRDDITLLLIARTERHTGIGSCEFYIRDADALHAELLAKGGNVQGAPVSRPWGLRDFAVLDLEGNRLTFAQTFE